MRKLLLAAVVSLAAVAALRAGEGKKGEACPLMVPGAQVKVEKTADGVVMRVTAADKEAVAQIQAAADSAGKGVTCACRHGKGGHGAHGKKAAAGAEKAVEKTEKVTCSMGDWSGPRPADGKCPKCGMKL